MIDKKTLSERDICTKFITPAVEKSGWNKLTQLAVNRTVEAIANGQDRILLVMATNLLFFDKGKPTKDIWYCEHRMPEGYKAYNKTRPIQVKEFEPIKEWWNNRKESEICWKVNIKTIVERVYDLDIKNPTKPEEEKEYNSTELMKMLNASYEKSHQLLNQLKQAVK